MEKTIVCELCGTEARCERRNKRFCDPCWKERNRGQRRKISLKHYYKKNAVPDKISCDQCGKVMEYEPLRKFCDDCRKERKNALDTRAARKRGHKKIKGTTARCKICKKEFERKRHNHNYCGSKQCDLERARRLGARSRKAGKKKEYDREYSKRRRGGDPIFALKVSIRNLIGVSFRRNGYNKGTKTE